MVGCKSHLISKFFKNGFTLIELLIVVAIIGILAAIAIPNFLQAQVRAKVGRAQADMRVYAIAIEQYHIDVGRYPPIVKEPTTDPFTWTERQVFLTTPVDYMSSILIDPFQDGSATGSGGSMGVGVDHAYPTDNDTLPGNAWECLLDREHRFKWDIRSYGPDKDFNDYNWVGLGCNGGVINYDPTNGTVSNGDIVYFGPGGGFGFNEIGMTRGY